jgi:hypothetical protein
MCLALWKERAAGDVWRGGEMYEEREPNSCLGEPYLKYKSTTPMLLGKKGVTPKPTNGA